MATRQQTKALTAVQGGQVAHFNAAFSQEQIDTLRRTVAKGASDSEMALFLEVARRRRMDPFTGQIHCVMRKVRNDQGGYDDAMTIQIGIDGFRATADRTGAFDGVEGPFWCGADGVWRDLWLDGEHPPAAAKVLVYRKGISRPFAGIAFWREYVQKRRDGAPTRTWAERGASQLAKCAEALALRKGFPEELGGLYAAEEMDQADNDAGPSRTEAGVAHVQAQWVEHEDPPAEASTVEVLPPAAAPVPPPPEATRAGRLYRAYRDLGMTKDLCKLAMAACGHKSTFSDKALDAWDADEFGFFLEVELGHWAEEHQAEVAAAKATQP